MIPIGIDGVAGVDARLLSAIAKTMYPDGPILLRKMQHWRPYICPFECLVGYVNSGSQVLDIGCGAGLLLSLLAGLKIEFSGIGFDVSRVAIDAARKMAERATVINPKARLSFEHVSTDANWPAGTFDAVFLVDVLHHVPAIHQEECLRRVASKVKPGGTLIFKDMCLGPWWKAQANRLHDLVVAHERITYVPIQRVESVLDSEGMELVLREVISQLWYGHELLIMRKEVDRPQ